MPTFDLETSIFPDHTVLALIGDFDRAVGPTLSRAGQAALSEPATQLLVVDLARVTSISSAALQALIMLRATADELAKELLLSHLPDRVQRLLDIVDPWAAGTGFGTRWAESPEGQPRCTDDDAADAGRCQLIAGHKEPHAASVGDAYLTWGPQGVHGWSIHVPPGWLTDLAWVTAFQPRTAH